MGSVRQLVLSLVLVAALSSLAQGQACPEGWQKYGLSCLQASGEYKNWYDARRACEFRGADLVSVTSPGMWKFLNDRRTTWTRSGTFWIYLEDHIEEGTFRWRGGAPATYVNWHENEPSNKYDNEHCVVMAGEGKYNDEDCNNKNEYVCELLLVDLTDPTLPTTPATTPQTTPSTTPATTVDTTVNAAVDTTVNPTVDTTVVDTTVNAAVDTTVNATVDTTVSTISKNDTQTVGELPSVTGKAAPGLSVGAIVGICLGILALLVTATTAVLWQRKKIVWPLPRPTSSPV